MDNYNALSKSAILTKLALDGYFIDLLTLNSFIKLWNIEAIYENEFGIEFFDNSSYLTILNNLKEKYTKTKESFQESLENDPILNQAKQEEIAKEEPSAAINEISNDSLKDDSSFNENASPEEECAIAPVLEQTNEDNFTENKEEIPPHYINEEEHTVETSFGLQNNAALETKNDEDNSFEGVSLEELARESAGQNQVYDVQYQDIPDKTQARDKSRAREKYAGAVMPMAMRNLTPGPVTPNSNLNVVHEDIDEFDEDLINPINNDDKLDEILERESFSQEEIEKANNLINNAKINNPQNQRTAENNKTKNDELDLVQLAQSFAQDLSGGISSEPVPPANLEQIFNESYTDPFEDLQSFVKETSEDIAQADDLLSNIAPPEIHPPAPVQRLTAPANLTAEDMREIIREEISRQAANTPAIPQNNDNIREIIKEIVKQTTDVAPQNAFKLDISNRTLDMIAKSIAKKIAVKLNDYYKLNSLKQEEKLKQFRDRTIDLKEKNQALAEENQKLKNTLMETRRDLNSYKPTIFGLYKFSGRKRK